MQSNERIAVVRAIPMPGHKRRWCGLETWVPDPEKRPGYEMRERPEGGLEPVYDENGKPVPAKHALPWPDSEIKVRIVEKPEPFDPEKNGGVPVEISPATLTMLERDHRISVRVLGGEGGDPAEIIRAKAAAAKLEEKQQDLSRELADERERSKRLHEEHAKQAQELAAQKAALEAELAAMRAQMSARKR